MKLLLPFFITLSAEEWKKKSNEKSSSAMVCKKIISYLMLKGYNASSFLHTLDINNSGEIDKKDFEIAIQVGSGDLMRNFPSKLLSYFRDVIFFACVCRNRKSVISGDGQLAVIKIPRHMRSCSKFGKAWDRKLIRIMMARWDWLCFKGEKGEIFSWFELRNELEKF